jgi:hypothetical protein
MVPALEAAGAVAPPWRNRQDKSAQGRLATGKWGAYGFTE